jgi:hypothetical protein
MTKPTTSRSAKARLRAARSEAQVAVLRVHHDGHALWTRFEEHRVAWLVAGGFIGGLALSSLPRRFWARIGGFAAASAAVVARSMLAPMIAGALVAKKQQGGGEDTAAEPGPEG